MLCKLIMNPSTYTLTLHSLVISNHCTYATAFFRVSKPPKKTEKQLTMLVIILSLMIASFGILLKLPKDVKNQNPGIFMF